MSCFPQPLTDQQQEIICKARQLMPENFSANTTDEKILAYAEVVLSEINFFPPLTGYTTENVPDRLKPVLYFGIQVFTMFFMQMRATLEDFDYNDNGLTVRVDQVGRIGAALQNMLQVFRTQVENFKKTQIFEVGGAGLGTPRFQSQIGQFLKIALGSAFTWHS
jgi:hypothetical protein